MTLLKNIQGRVRGEAQALGSHIDAETGGIQRSQPRLVNGFLIKEIEVSDNAPEGSRVGEGDYTHASGLIDVCVRQHVLARIHGVRNFEGVNGAMRVVWAMGRAAENHVRKAILRTRQMRGVYGVWKCRCEKTQHRGFHPSESQCGTCGTGLIKYFEPPLIDEHNKIVGNPDLTLQVGNGYMAVVEIKSMNKKDFMALSRPKGDHILQAGMYQRLYKRSGFTMHDHVVILYVQKDFSFKKIYKEFHVDVTQEPWKTTLEEMEQDGSEIQTRTASGILPPRTKCSSPADARAKKCKLATLCFSME